MALKAHAFCHYCGAPHTQRGLERLCLNCGETTYLNSVPIIILVIPYGDGFLMGRRAIEPCIGQWSHVSGYVLGETWQQACVREGKEELDVDLDIGDIKLLEQRSIIKAGIEATVAIHKGTEPSLSRFRPNREVSERDIVRIDSRVQFAFPLHLELVQRFTSNQALLACR